MIQKLSYAVPTPRAGYGQVNTLTYISTKIVNPLFDQIGTRPRTM